MLRYLIPCCLVVLMISNSADLTAAAPPNPAIQRAKAKAPKPARVGQIFIVGNYRTPQKVILAEVPFYPGKILTFADLNQATRNLKKLGIFKNSKDVQPSVTVLDSNPESEFKDILIEVAEKVSINR